MSRIPLTVVLADDPTGDPIELAGRLSEIGVQIDEVHELLGVISCRAERTTIPAILDLPGVAAVEEDRPIGIPPPDADVQ